MSPYFGKILIFLGIFLVAIGILFLFGLPSKTLKNRIWESEKIPFFGRLPGDLYIKRENFTFYFPLATSILISIILSLLLYIIFKIFR